MTRQQLESKIRTGLLDNYFSSVIRVSRPGEKEGEKLLGFILGSIMIDYLAGFYSGIIREELKTRGVATKSYKSFVQRYLPSYNADVLWESVRSLLVHNYSVGGNYGFTHLEQDGKHLAQVRHANNVVYTVLNLEDFLTDIKGSAEALLRDIATDDELFLKAHIRYESIGLIDYIDPIRKQIPKEDVTPPATKSSAPAPKPTAPSTTPPKKKEIPV